MTRQEQIIEAWCKYRGKCSTEILQALAFALKWSDEHPAWISVEDELPEACVAVLTTTQNGTQRVGCYEDGWWLANSPDLVRMGSITHWMPLPSPPEHFADVSKKISGSSEIPNNHTKTIEKGGKQ